MPTVKVGEYWAAGSCSHDLIWLFLIVASATVKRRRCVLAAKCDWKTRAPLIHEELTNAWWFLEKDGACVDKEFDFYLAYKVRGNGLRYLQAGHVPEGPASQSAASPGRKT